MVDIITILIILFDFVVSIWNAYASGCNIGLLRKAKTKVSGLMQAAAYSGIGLAFAGMAYVMMIVLSFLAASFGYVDPGTVNFVLGFDFLVFGLLIIGFGLMVTVQSIVIAIQRKNIWSIVGAAWNVFAEVWDIASYISGFKESVNMLKGENKDEETNAIIIIIVALLLAFFITHAAYNHGLNKAQNL